jgi:branched-chain amino acid transport system permease protein
MKHLFQGRGNAIGIILLIVTILAIGWFETTQPGGRDFGDLSGDVLTFNTVVRIGLLTIVVVGLNLLMGYAGQVSLGQAAFYGLGAYVSAIFTARGMVVGLPEGLVTSWWWPWLLIIAGMLLTGGFTYLVGRPILNLKGHYLAMATLGLGIVIFILFRENFGFSPNTLNLTGGFDGISDVPRLRLGRYELWPVERYYYLVWFFAILSLIVSLNIVDSRVGRALRAIHGGEVAAEAMGIDTARFKVRVLVYSTMLASLAGSLFAHFQAAVSPTPFGFVGSLELVVMAAVGGMGAVWGAPLGVALILTIEELLRSKLHLLIEGVGSEVEPVIFGLILVVIMIFLPNGLAPGLNRLLKRRTETHPASPQTTPSEVSS